jgi:DNA-binding transcriptional regulator GbsR (MarR family)
MLFFFVSRYSHGMVKHYQSIPKAFLKIAIENLEDISNVAVDAVKNVYKNLKNNGKKSEMKLRNELEQIYLLLKLTVIFLPISFFALLYLYMEFKAFQTLDLQHLNEIKELRALIVDLNSVISRFKSVPNKFTTKNYRNDPSSQFECRIL